MLNRLSVHTRKISRLKPTPIPLENSKIREILNTTKFRSVYQTLLKSPNHFVTLSKYQEICSKIGVSKDHGRELMKNLESAGLLVSLENEDCLMVKPEEFSTNLFNLIKFNSSHFVNYVNQRKSELKSIQENYECQMEVNKKIDKLVKRHCKRFMLTGSMGLMTFTAVVCRLTFWDLSWDIMEPVTYMLNMFFLNSSIFFFIISSQEFRYQNLHAIVEKRKKSKLALKFNFDARKFEELNRKREECIQKIANPEKFFFDDYWKDLDKKKVD